MRQLTKQQKAFLVTRLATFSTPSEAAAAFQEEYGEEIPRNHASRYDPSTVQGESLAADLKELFWKTREEFIANVKAIPIMNQSFRAQELLRLYRANPRNPALQAQLLEQAAKEEGGLFRARREITGKDGAPVVDISAALQQMFAGWSDEQLEAYAARGEVSAEVGEASPPTV